MTTINIEESELTALIAMRNNSNHHSNADSTASSKIAFESAFIELGKKIEESQKPTWTDSLGSIVGLLTLVAFIIGGGITGFLNITETLSAVKHADIAQNKDIDKLKIENEKDAVYVEAHKMFHSQEVIRQDFYKQQIEARLNEIETDIDGIRKQINNLRYGKQQNNMMELPIKE